MADPTSTHDGDPDMDRIFDLASRGWLTNEIMKETGLEYDLVEGQLNQAYNLLGIDRPPEPDLANAIQMKTLAAINSLLRTIHRYDLDRKPLAGSLHDYAKATEIAVKLGQQLAGAVGNATAYRAQGRSPVSQVQVFPAR